MNSLKRGSFKLFGSGSEEHKEHKEKDVKTRARGLSMTKASSVVFPVQVGSLTTSSLSKSSSFSAYPQPYHQNGAGSKTLQLPSKAARTLRRRESLDFSDILRKYDKDNDSRPKTPPTKGLSRRPSEQMRAMLRRSRTLPCISSWDLYGDDHIVVTFQNSRASSFSHLTEHLHGLRMYTTFILSRFAFL